MATTSALLMHGTVRGAQFVGTHRQAAAARPMGKAQSSRSRSVTVAIAAPERPNSLPQVPGSVRKSPPVVGPTVSRDVVRGLERELDTTAQSLPALRRFHTLLEQLPADEVHRRLAPVWAELCYNLESFNPVFTAVLLKVQCTLGQSDYVRRDAALQCLIVPLAGEYGLAAEYKLGKTHRQLFADFYASVTGQPLDAFLASHPACPHAEHFFASMLNDVANGGGQADAMSQASYALGYNLAVEYLAAYEKTWMLDAFRVLNDRVLAAQGKTLDWVFLEVHAVGEPMHAELGHAAVTSMVPADHVHILRKAMHDHDRDFAAFYNACADLLEA